MSEWWTYSLTDVLLFSPKIYFCLLARYNHTIWPAQLSALAAGLALLGLGLLRDPRFPSLALGALALAWAWCGWAFHWQRYSGINWAVTWFAIGFFIQAALLTFAATVRPHQAIDGWDRQVGAAVTLVALAYPLLVLLGGRPIVAGSVAGLAPDPTAIGTLGLILMVAQPSGP